MKCVFDTFAGLANGTAVIADAVFDNRPTLIGRQLGDAHPMGGFHMRSDIVPGAVFPDYELSDHTAKHRKLSELQGQHPMVLVLSRGGF
jgi:hypothetical protein